MKFISFLFLCYLFPVVHTSAHSTPCKIGFLGCGTIASALATGLATQTEVDIAQIAVTKRSERKSSQLAEKFSLVKVMETPQEVVDASDIVFVTLLPEQTSPVLQSLSLESRHTLVSVVSTSKLPDLIQDSQLPMENVCKVICLPAVAQRQSVSLVLHPTNQLRAILASLGGYVCCDTEDQMSDCMVITGLMGPLYGLLRQHVDWLVRQGLPAATADSLVRSQYRSMLLPDQQPLDDLIAEQTPGGLNEQALANLEQLGVLDRYDEILDALQARLHGRTDGSIP